MCQRLLERSILNKRNHMLNLKKIMFIVAIALITITMYPKSETRANMDKVFANLSCNTSQGAQTTFSIQAESKKNTRWTSLFISSAAGEDPIVDTRTGVCEAGSECKVNHYAPFPGLGRTWTTQITLTPSGSYSRQSIGCTPS